MALEELFGNLLNTLFVGFLEVLHEVFEFIGRFVFGNTAGLGAACGLGSRFGFLGGLRGRGIRGAVSARGISRSTLFEMVLEFRIGTDGFSNGTMLRSRGVAKFTAEGAAPVLVTFMSRARRAAVVRIIISFLVLILTLGVKAGSLTSTSSLGIGGDVDGFVLFQKLMGLGKSSWICSFVAL